MSQQQPAGSDPLPLSEAASRLMAEAAELGDQLSPLITSGCELLKAELALSRSALSRILLQAVIALMLAGSAWACLLAALVLGLHALGCPWWLAALLAASACLLGSLVCLYAIKRFLPDLGWPRSQQLLRQLLQPATQQDPKEPSA